MTPAPAAAQAPSPPPMTTGVPAALPGLRRRVPGLRPTAAGVAPSGHDAIPNPGAGGGAAGALRGARRRAGAGAVGGSAVALHGPVRSDGDRLAEGGQLRRRGAAVPVELRPSDRDPGTGGSAGVVAVPGGRGGSGRGGFRTSRRPCTRRGAPRRRVSGSSLYHFASSLLQPGIRSCTVHGSLRGTE